MQDFQGKGDCRQAGCGRGQLGLADPSPWVTGSQTLQNFPLPMQGKKGAPAGLLLYRKSASRLKDLRSAQARPRNTTWLVFSSDRHPVSCF